MSLVRCTCLGHLDADRQWVVDVPDRDCGYVIHRLEASFL